LVSRFLVVRLKHLQGQHEHALTLTDDLARSGDLEHVIAVRHLGPRFVE
jgi:hypothetical protein